MAQAFAVPFVPTVNPVWPPGLLRSTAATSSSSACVVAAPSATAGDVPPPEAEAVRSSAPVAASPANSAARAAMLTPDETSELLTVIAEPAGRLWTPCLAQIADRTLLVVVCTSVVYAPLTGSAQVMVVPTLLVATNTRMLSPAATAPVVLIVAVPPVGGGLAEVLHEGDGRGGGGGQRPGGQGGERRRQRHRPEEAAHGSRADGGTAARARPARGAGRVRSDPLPRSRLVLPLAASSHRERPPGRADYSGAGRPSPYGVDTLLPPDRGGRPLPGLRSAIASGAAGAGSIRGAPPGPARVRGRVP